MTFVGRILIVVIVLMSVCVAAFTSTAYTVQQNWKTAYAEMKGKYETSNAGRDADRSKSEEQITTLGNDLSKVTDERNAALGREGGFKQQLAAAVDLNQELRTDLDQEQASNALLAAENKDTRESNNNLSAQLRDTQQKNDLLAADKSALQDKVYTLDKQNKDMNKKHNGVLLKLGEYTAFHRKIQQTLGLTQTEKILRAGKLPPIVEADVVAIQKTDRGKTTLVEISIGSDDGLSLGDTLEVYGTRHGKDKYLGTIRIISITADKAGGELNPKTKNGIIEKGDHVTTQL